MAITYRAARIGDLQAVADVYRLSLSDVYSRHGFADQLMLPQGANPFYAFILREEPEGFFVAEDTGKVIGATYSWVRGSFWFLSHLFVLPEYQGRGIGKALLEMTLAYCAKSDATTRSVITMAFNPSSISLYMKNGMYPIQDILLMRSSRIGGEINIEHIDTITLEVAGPAAWRNDELKTIDEEVLGMNRLRHHRFFIEGQQARCLIFRNNERAIAYSYIWQDGRIGPVAAVKDAPYDAVLKKTIDIMGQYCSDISIMVPGSNRVVMETAFSLGFTVSLPYIILASQDFGAWDRYMFHSPGMM